LPAFAGKLSGAMAASGATIWTEHVHAVLTRAGLKHGGARQRIIDLLAREPCALSAVEIEDALRAEGKPTGRASIYRVLDLLVDHGLVERVSVGQGLARFERTHPSGEHHHHLCATSAGGWWRSTTQSSSRRSTACPSDSECGSSTTTWVLHGACERCE
jgi:Fur family transcriptional regulator, ferric uptake regulator